MNNDGVTSITWIDTYHMEKFIRFLPAGPTDKSFRARPLIQFYRDRYTFRGRDGYGFIHTICPEDIIGVKGMTDAQIAAKLHEVRGRVVEKPKKVRRRNQLKK